MARDLLDLPDSEYSSLLRKVAGVDLPAAEAHYHDICLHKFYSKHQSIKGYHQSKEEERVLDQNHTFTIHNQAYNIIKDVIKQRILVNLEVLPLTLLRDQYIGELEKLGKVDSTYRSEKLLKNLRKDDEISQQLSFSKVDSKGCISFWLIFSSKLSVSEAVSSAYHLASKDKLKDAASQLRDIILKAFKKSKDLPWPVTPDEIGTLSGEGLPEELERSTFQD